MQCVHQPDGMDARERAKILREQAGWDADEARRIMAIDENLNMKEVADQLGVSGWVRNLPDGSVEAVVEGERQRVEELIKWAHRGPPAARVEAVEVEWEPYKGEFKGFKIKYY